MTDTERLDWLQKKPGSGLLSDFTGRWAFSFDGLWSFDVEGENWKPSIREAIDYAIKCENNA